MRAIVKEFVQPTCRLLVTASPTGWGKEFGIGSICRIRFHLKVADTTISGDKNQIQDLIREVNVYVDQLLGKKFIDTFSHQLFVYPDLELKLTTVQLFDLWTVLEELERELVILPTPEVKKRRSPWWLVIVGVCVSFGVYWWHSNQSFAPESAIRISQPISPELKPEISIESAPPEPVIGSAPQTMIDSASDSASRSNPEPAISLPNAPLVTASTTLRIKDIVPADRKNELSQAQKSSAIIILEEHWQRALPTPIPQELPKSFVVHLVITNTQNGSIANIQIPDQQRKQKNFLLKDANKLNPKLEFLPAGKYIIHLELPSP